MRLHFATRLSQRAIAASLGLSQGAVSGYLSRARAAGVSWPLPEDVDEARLEALLFRPPSRIPADQRPMPDWGWVHRELRRPDVTLALLWEEYRAGELFVDFARRTAEVIDVFTGEIIPVQIFVAVLDASSFTYAEAVRSQKLPDWIAAHVRAFAYFGGAARQTVGDNLKAELDCQRDAVLEDGAPDKAGEMIQQLATLRGIGVQSATVLVREAFVRDFANAKALGSYAGLPATPNSNGRVNREQGIREAGNRRLRTVMVELAWLR